jgi:hypothetical protein
MAARSPEHISDWLDTGAGWYKIKMSAGGYRIYSKRPRYFRLTRYQGHTLGLRTIKCHEIRVRRSSRWCYILIDPCLLVLTSRNIMTKCIVYYAYHERVVIVTVYSQGSRSGNTASPLEPPLYRSNLCTTGSSPSPSFSLVSSFQPLTLRFPAKASPTPYRSDPHGAYPLRFSPAVVPSSSATTNSC